MENEVGIRDIIRYKSYICVWNILHEFFFSTP